MCPFGRVWLEFSHSRNNVVPSFVPSARVGALKIQQANNLKDSKGLRALKIVSSMASSQLPCMDAHSYCPSAQQFLCVGLLACLVLLVLFLLWMLIYQGSIGNFGMLRNYFKDLKWHVTILHYSYFLSIYCVFHFTWLSLHVCVLPFAQTILKYIYL